MTSLFDAEYARVTGTENATVVLWVCPNDGCETAALLSYWADPRCSLCNEPLERSES